MAETKTEAKQKEGGAAPKVNLVPIYVMGERYLVPDSLTIQKALEYAGYQLIRGCGCRGGICGACATVFRMPGSYRIEVGLACQTIVKADMHLTQIPFFPANKAVYNLDELKPTGSTLASLYPELFKCVGCNTCTRSCPMDIEVMEYISQAIRGNIAKVAELSFDCVMCGLCTARCPAEEVQYNVAILCRRLYGKHIAPKDNHLAVAVKNVEEKKYDEGLQKLMKAGVEELKKIYVAREVEPEMADDSWTPKDSEYL